jgi:CDGSH-type Zn-finger protein
MSGATVTVTVRPNGPILVTGPIVLVDPTGQQVVCPPDRPVALCRCGASTMKPFCDGSHSRVGFQSHDAAPPR